MDLLSKVKGWELSLFNDGRCGQVRLGCVGICWVGIDLGWLDAAVDKVVSWRNDQAPSHYHQPCYD
jgi:hypothetical protein